MADYRVPANVVDIVGGTTAFIGLIELPPEQRVLEAENQRVGEALAGATLALADGQAVAFPDGTTYRIDRITIPARDRHR